MELFIKQADGSYFELWSHLDSQNEVTVVPAVEEADENRLSFFVKQQGVYRLLTEWTVEPEDHRVRLTQEGNSRCLSVFNAMGEDCGLFDWTEEEEAALFPAAGKEGRRKKRKKAKKEKPAKAAKSVKEPKPVKQPKPQKAAKPPKQPKPAKAAKPQKEPKPPKAAKRPKAPKPQKAAKQPKAAKPAKADPAIAARPSAGRGSTGFWFGVVVLTALFIVGVVAFWVIKYLL